MRRLLALLLLVLLSACSSGSTPQRPSQAELDRVRAVVAGLPSVSEATVAFLDGPAVTGSRTALVTVTLGSGADRAALTAAVAETVWKSRITPLDEIKIRYATADPRVRPDVVDLSLRGSDGAALREKYGARPAS